MKQIRQFLAAISVLGPQVLGVGNLNFNAVFWCPPLLEILPLPLIELTY